MTILAVFPRLNGCCTGVILVVSTVIQWLSVDFNVFCMPVSPVVSLGRICLYAVIASNQMNKNKFV